MAHTIIDSDAHFIINTVTRQIRNDGTRKTTLIQNDHNSERFTFSLDRYVECHDMGECNVVEVHYLNVSKDGKTKNTGMYTVEDLHVDGDKVTCSWLISQNATQLVGSLTFLLRFKCVEDNIITYAWHTAIHTGIMVSDGINADETFELDYVDIIAQWKAVITREITDDVSANVSEWAELESGKVRGEMTAFSAQWNEALSVERKRIDNMVSGGTVDDAELMDIRVGADGVTYDSAGTAVREQFNDIYQEVDNIKTRVTTFKPLFTDYSNMYSVDAQNVTLANNKWSGTFDKEGAYCVLKYLFEAGKTYLLNYKVRGVYTEDKQRGYLRWFTTSYGWGDRLESIGINAPYGGYDEQSLVVTPATSAWLAMYNSTGNSEELPFEIEIYIYDITTVSESVLNAVDVAHITGTHTVCIADVAANATNADNAKIANNAYGKWYGKKGWFCGDSITEYGWYPSRLADILGMDGFYQDGHSGHAISGCVDGIVNDPSLLDGYDLLTIFAGTNDFGGNKDIGTIDSVADTNTTYGSLKLIIQTILSAKPNLRMVFFTPLPRGKFDTQPGYGATNGRGKTLVDYCDAIKQVCSMYHIPCVDLHNLVGWNEYNILTKTLDGLHPTKEHTICDLVPLMAAQLKTL